MSLSDLASIGGFASGVAVVISLLYLSVQIRQNTKHQRAAMQQGRAGRTVDILLSTSNVDIARAILRGRAGEIEMEAVELEQFLRVVSAMFTSFEDGYVLRQSGMLDEATVAADEAAMKNAILPWPGYRAAWDMLKMSMQPRFRDYIDSLLQVTPVIAETDRMIVWRRLLSDRRAAKPGRASG
jgi:hypothetical protein